MISRLQSGTDQTSPTSKFDFYSNSCIDECMESFRLNVDEDGEFVVEGYDGYSDEWTREAYIVPTGWARDDNFNTFEDLMDMFDEVTEQAWQRLQEYRS